MKLEFAITFIIFFSFSITGFGQVGALRNTLNGKTFEIKLKESGKNKTGWKWERDEFSFDFGKFKSKEMNVREKFPDAAYQLSLNTASSTNEINFKVGSENRGGSQIVIEGVVKNDSIKGTAEWTNRLGTQSYIFSGIKK